MNKGGWNKILWKLKCLKCLSFITPSFFIFEKDCCLSRYSPLPGSFLNKPLLQRFLVYETSDEKSRIFHTAGLHAGTVHHDHCGVQTSLSLAHTGALFALLHSNNYFFLNFNKLGFYSSASIALWKQQAGSVFHSFHKLFC